MHLNIQRILKHPRICSPVKNVNQRNVHLWSCRHGLQMNRRRFSLRVWIVVSIGKTRCPRINHPKTKCSNQNQNIKLQNLQITKSPIFASPIRQGSPQNKRDFFFFKFFQSNQISINHCRFNMNKYFCPRIDLFSSFT